MITHEIHFVDSKKPVFALILKTMIKKGELRTIYTIDPSRMVDFKQVLTECTEKFKKHHSLKD